MAGNVGLLKHASNVPQCALAIEDIFRRAGFPAGCFQTLLIDTSNVKKVIEDPRIAAVTLTGSTGAGGAVASTAGKVIKKTVLELGGSDPFVVMPSADLDVAVRTAVKARTINNGQSCIAAKRFIVAESIADEFERKFVEGFKALKVGDPMDPATDIGPLANENQVETIADQVEKSVAAGAKVVTGGQRLNGKGFYYAPTVLTGVTPSSPAYHDEVFGPVAIIFRVRTLDDAIRVANDSPFGLGASAWTTDPGERRAVRVGARIGHGVHQRDGRIRSAPAVRRGQAVGLWAGAGGQRSSRIRQHQVGLDTGRRALAEAFRLGVT